MSVNIMYNTALNKDKQPITKPPRDQQQPLDATLHPCNHWQLITGTENLTFNIMLL